MELNLQALGLVGAAIFKTAPVANRCAPPYWTFLFRFYWIRLEIERSEVLWYEDLLSRNCRCLLKNMILSLQ